MHEGMVEAENMEGIEDSKRDTIKHIHTQTDRHSNILNYVLCMT